MRRALLVLAALVVISGAMAHGIGAVPAAKTGPCATPDPKRDYVPPSSPDDGLLNGATGVTNVVAVRVSKLNSYTAARFVGGEADGKVGIWGASRLSPRHDASAWGLDRNARRYDVQGVDVPVSKVARNFGLRASDPGAKKARKCVRDAAGGQ